MPRPHLQPSIAGRDTTGLRAIAIYEAAKALVVIAAVDGAVTLMHRGLGHLALDALRRMHLDPITHLAGWILAAAQRVEGVNVNLLIAAAAAYAAVRFAEAWGLWYDRAWGEWIGALSGGVYLPLETFELARRPTLPRLLFLLGNIAIVAFLGWHLWKRKTHRYVVTPLRLTGPAAVPLQAAPLAKEEHEPAD